MRLVGDAYVASNATIRGDVVLGPGANVWFNAVVRGDLARISLGPRVNLQDGVIVHTDRDAPMEIEEGVLVGHAAILHGKRIGRDTLVGMGAILLSGCDIGAECLIAAGTLIPEGKVIPPRSVVVGSPGRVVRAITEEEIQHTRRGCAGYLQKAKDYAEGRY